MTVKKVGDIWLVDIRPDGSEGKRVRKKFATKGEALRYEAHIKSQANQGDWNPKPKDKRSFKDLVIEWHKAHGHLLKDGERRKKKLLDISEEWKNPTGTTILPKTYTDYRAKRIEQGISLKTCNNELGYINAVFNELNRTQAIDYENPLKSIRAAKIDENELSYLEKDQIAELLEKIESFSENKHVLIVTKLCLATGARWSEIEGLTLKQLKRYKVSLHKTKSHKSRTIPISEGLYKEMHAHLKEHGSFGTSTISAFRRAMNQTTIELPKGQNAHALRHTFASHFIMNGGNILTLQKILGHSSIVQTMRYAHLAPEHLEDAVRLNPLA